MAKQTEGKSKRRIQQAFLQLLIRRDIGEIKVKDIIDLADVSRSAFYAHYDSKYELAEEIERSLIDGFTEIMLRLRKAGKDTYYSQIDEKNNIYFEEYFKYIQHNSLAFKALLNPTSGTGFSARFSNAITKMRVETTQLWNHECQGVLSLPPLLQYREEVMSSLYVSLFSAWLDRDMDMTPKEMAVILASLWKPMLSIPWLNLLS